MTGTEAPSIHSYQWADHQAVAGLNRHGVTAAGAPEDADIYSGDLDDIATTYLTGRAAVLVGVVDAFLAAMGGLREIDIDICEIVRMRVHPAQQRRGRGRAVLRALDQCARRYRRAELVTGPD